MDTHLLHPWALDRPIDSPFALPRGPLGRLAGRFMLWKNQPDDAYELLGVEPAQRVLEVGYGPGGMIRLLAERSGAASICGVDPSTTMLESAGKLNRRAIAERRVELRIGTAEATGLPDASFDRVVSINNVALWPDLEAGLRELHRVLRPGGVILLSWHGGEGRSYLARKLRLPDDKLQLIRAGLEALFATVERFERARSVLFRARK